MDKSKNLQVNKTQSSCRYYHEVHPRRRSASPLGSLNFKQAYLIVEGAQCIYGSSVSPWLSSTKPISDSPFMKFCQLPLWQLWQQYGNVNRTRNRDWGGGNPVTQYRTKGDMRRDVIDQEEFLRNNTQTLAISSINWLLLLRNRSE